MRWHQHNHQAIYGRPPRTEVKQVSPGSYNGGEARVCVIGANTGEEMRLKKEMGEVLWTWAVSGSSLNPNRFSIFSIRSLYAISWFRSTNRA
jgi:hypothetical protein